MKYVSISVHKEMILSRGQGNNDMEEARVKPGGPVRRLRSYQQE